MLGPFSVDPEGRLSPARPDLSPVFSVRWRGRTVHACLSQGTAPNTSLDAPLGEGHLRIRSILGRIPSTASGPAVREACLTLFRGLLTAVPETWTMRLLPDHRPQVEAALMVALPITVTGLVTELTAFLLDLAPYLDVMDDAGVSLVTEPSPSMRAAVPDRGIA